MGSSNSTEIKKPDIIQGSTGPKGDTGDIGPRGFKGDTGDIGPRGFTGVMGPRGFTGEPGPRGFTGDIGSRGFTGEMGPMGPRGFTGEKGKDLVLNNDITVSSIRIGNTNYSINQNGLFSASSLNISSATGISGYIGIDDSLIYKNDLTNLKNLTAGKYLLTDITSKTLNVGGSLPNEKTSIDNSGYLTAPKIFTSDFDTGIDQDGVRSKKLIIKDSLGTTTTTIDNNGVFSTKNITGFNFTGQNINGRNGFFSEKINSSNLSIGYNGPNGQENFVVDSGGNITKVNNIQCSSGSSISGNIIYSKSVYSDSINVKGTTGYNTYIDNTSGVRTDRLSVGNTIIDATNGITLPDRVKLNNINANNASFYNLDITDVNGNRVGGIDRLGDLSVRTLTLGNQQNININGLNGSIEATGFITAGNLQSNNNLFVRNGYIDTSGIQIGKGSTGEYTYITDKGINTNSLNIIGTTTNFDSTGRLSLNRADVSSLIRVGGGNTTVDISPTGGISCNNVRISTNSSLNGRSLTINENYSSIDQNGNVTATSLTLRPMSDNVTTTPAKLTIGGLTIEPDGTTGGIIKGATLLFNPTGTNMMISNTGYINASNISSDSMNSNTLSSKSINILNGKTVIDMNGINSSGNLKINSITLQPFSSSNTGPRFIKVGGLTIEPSIDDLSATINGANFSNLNATGTITSNSVTSNQIISNGNITGNNITGTNITGNVIQGNSGTKIDEFGNVRISSNKRICLDNVCLSKNQLKTLILNNNLITPVDYEFNWYYGDSISNDCSWICPFQPSTGPPLYLFFNTKIVQKSNNGYNYFDNTISVRQYTSPSTLSYNGSFFAKGTYDNYFSVALSGVPLPATGSYYYNFVNSNSKFVRELATGTNDYQAEKFSTFPCILSSDKTQVKFQSNFPLEDCPDFTNKCIQLKSGWFIFGTISGKLFYINKTFADFAAGILTYFPVDVNRLNCKPIRTSNRDATPINNEYPSLDICYIIELLDTSKNAYGYLGKKYAGVNPTTNTGNYSSDFYFASETLSDYNNSSNAYLSWNKINNFHPPGEQIYCVNQLNDGSLMGMDSNYNVWICDSTIIGANTNLSALWIKTGNKIPYKIVSTRLEGSNITRNPFPTPFSQLNFSSMPTDYGNAYNILTPGFCQLPDKRIISWGNKNNGFSTNFSGDALWITGIINSS